MVFLIDLWDPLACYQWLEDLFEYEDCEECGRGASDHLCVPGPFGLPFAYCFPSEEA